MKLQPIISWWLLSPYLIAVLSFVGWQFWRIRHQKRRDRPALLARWFRRSALLVLPVIIALGPSVQGGVSSPGTANLDVIFVVDTTPSMGALDYESKRQRIEGVKQDLLALSDGLQGAHMQIITFDTEANVILPLTTDVTAFSTAVQSMTPQIKTFRSKEQRVAQQFQYEGPGPNVMRLKHVRYNQVNEKNRAKT